MFGFLNKKIVIATNRKESHPNKHHIKKRHWCLGSFVILFGSWITHTTTASISDGLVANDSGLTFGEFTAMTEAANTAVPASNTVSIQENAQESFTNEIAKLSKPNFTEVAHTVKKGQTLGSIFKQKKFDLALPHYISQHSIAKQLVSLSIGKELVFRKDASDQLRELSYPINALQELLVEIDDGMVHNAKIIDLPFETLQHEVSAEITNSLYQTALDAGLSRNLIMDMVNIFGWDIDFAQDLRAGDTFHIIFTDHQIDGEKVADGDILAAEFTTQGRIYRAIRFKDDEGNISYYTPEGESMLGTFLRSPVEFSRISSRFGKRRHPISKKWKAHKGVDYAASRGTPIRATADGKVIHAGNKGGYGKTIILRHAGKFTTLYAHMNGYAKGVRSGTRVKQGQTIGYVGSTGYSTGPHLHYEFRVNGVHRNSLTYKTPKASSVKPELKTKFNRVSKIWTAKLDTVQKNYTLAKAKTETGTKKI